MKLDSIKKQTNHTTELKPLNTSKTLDFNAYQSTPPINPETKQKILKIKEKDLKKLFDSRRVLSSVYEAHSDIDVLGPLASIHCNYAVEHNLNLAKSIFSNSRDAVMITNSDGLIVDVNQSFLDMTGYQKTELINRNPRILSSGLQSKQFYTEMWTTMLRQGYWSGQVINKKKNGELYNQSSIHTAIKNENDELIFLIGIFKDITQEINLKNQVKKMQEYDPLTGLPNRIKLKNKIDSSISKMSADDNHAFVINLDICQFKLINDTHGHDFGDKTLKTVASRLRDLKDTNCFIARTSGDEFCFFIEGDPSTSLEQQHRSFQEKLFEIQNLFFSPLVFDDGEQIEISLNIGISCFPNDGNHANELLKNADSATYQAKRSPNETTIFYNEEITSGSSKRLKVMECIKESLRCDHFYLVFQPKYDTSTNTIIGSEALLRSRIQKKYGLTTTDIIEVAEQVALIPVIGDVVSSKVFEQCKRWISSNINFGKVSFNVSILDLEKPGFIESLKYKSKKYGVPLELIEIEVTERVTQSGKGEIKNILWDLNNLGIDCSIDDFGTGYSSLSQLNALPFGTIKIDKCFIDEIDGKNTELPILKTIIYLASQLNLGIIAEGVEHKNQVEILQKLGCNQIQGYYFSRPLIARKFIELLSGPNDEND